MSSLKYRPDRGPSMNNCRSTSLLKSEEQCCNHQMQLQSGKCIMADNDLQNLKEENKLLKYELENLRHVYFFEWLVLKQKEMRKMTDGRLQYQQLLEKKWNGHYDERRVTLLKAQIMQLERQVVLLTEGLSSRAAQMLEIENALERLNDRFRSLLRFESPISEVPVSRAELMQFIGMCQSLQKRLQKWQTAANVENLSMMWLMSGRNLTKQPVTLLELCYGRMDNLNLQRVCILESKLCKLYRHLNAIKHILSLILAPGQESHSQVCHILPRVVYARLLNQVTRCNQSLEECCIDLLTITLIVPSAPWVKAQQVELDFHKSMYGIQVKYTEALFHAIKQAYHAFQENVAKVLCLPLQEVLISYTNLKETASETALRNFLTAFKNNAEQIQDAVNALMPLQNQHTVGDEALSRFGKDFFLSLECCIKDCADQRDLLTSELVTSKEEFSHALETLDNLRKERMEKQIDGRHASQCAPKPGRLDGKVKVDKISNTPQDQATREELNSLTTEASIITTESSIKHRSGTLISNSTTERINTTLKSQDDPSKQGSSERYVSQRTSKPVQKSKTKVIQQRPPWQD
ncbi:uncharacterized protein [Scyliorhinus torazame]|uniref:uncharacterized protein isoform X3 n=1 Tax=Scyliorhinus torazame TaxID=75743 RepID=UPI003B591430